MHLSQLSPLSLWDQYIGVSMQLLRLRKLFSSNTWDVSEVAHNKQVCSLHLYATFTSKTLWRNQMLHCGQNTCYAFKSTTRSPNHRHHCDQQTFTYTKCLALKLNDCTTPRKPSLSCTTVNVLWNWLHWCSTCLQTYWIHKCLLLTGINVNVCSILGEQEDWEISSSR